MKRSLVFLLSFILVLGAGAQEKTGHNGIPADVYYLMPEFGNGMVYLRGQRPAQGRLNICAVDNTLRFLGPDGKELTATQDGDVIKVRIDSVMFLRDQNIFYRLHPLTSGLGVALRREVRILRDVKEGAYGTTSQTTSVQNYGTYYADGVVYNLDSDKEYPYTVSELVCIYKDDVIYPLTRKNLRKLFPARKDEIDAFFKSGEKLPETVPDALDFLSRWTD
jgi:hypothetical protein